MNNYKIFRLTGYVLVAIFLATSCEIDSSLEGSGVVTTRRHAIQQFTDIDINGVLNAYFIQGEAYKLEVATDDNLHSLVKIVNEENTLKVYTNTSDDFEATEMNVYITAPEVSSIYLDGVTALYIEQPLRQNSLVIDKKNTGQVLVTGAFQYFTLYSDGIGDVKLVGASDNALIENFSTGDLQAYNFVVQEMTLVHGGTGVAEIQVVSELNIDISGVGDVYCKGEPTTISKTGSGLGRLYIVD